MTRSRHRGWAVGLLLGAGLMAAPAARADVVVTAIDPGGGHIYHLIGDPDGFGGFRGLTWADAEAEAVTLGAGAHLATIGDATENTWVADMFSVHTFEAWIGLNDVAAEGTFVWASGSPAAYRNWWPGQPNDGGGGEDHVLMSLGGEARWDDRSGPDNTRLGLVELANAFSRFDWNQPAGGAYGAGNVWTPPGPPGSGDGAYFDLDQTYTVSFGAPAGALLLFVGQGDVTFDLNAQAYTVDEAYIGDGGLSAVLTVADGTLSSDRSRVGFAPDSAGVVHVGAGGTWRSAEVLRLGDHGVGSLNIEAGGRAESFEATLGLQATGVGAATVSGNGATWDNTGRLIVGSRGSGALLVDDQGVVDTEGLVIAHWNGSSGSVEVVGPDARLTSTGPEVMAVGERGIGSLTVRDGARVSGEGWAKVGGEYVGARGSVRVADPGSNWTVAGGLDVGRTGQGTLSIEGGGAVTSGTLFIGAQQLGDGVVRVVDTGSTLTVANGNWLVVGRESRGVLEVESGGQIDVSAGGTIVVGDSHIGAGHLAVSGLGSTVVTTSNLHVGGSGTGSMAIGDQGAVTAASATVGDQAGSYGAVTVVGGESSLTVTNWDLTVGQSGHGVLGINDGALAEVQSGAVYVGRNVDSEGRLDVSGLGSSLTLPFDLNVGNAGRGALVVTAGARVTNDGAVVIGREIEGEGEVVVEGTGSALVNSSNHLTVGLSGRGALSVRDGGTVSVPYEIYLGQSATANGTLLVEGPGSTLGNDNGSLWIGWSGTGRMDVIDGGNVSTASEGMIGVDPDVEGTAVVSGPGSRWDVTRGLFVGRSGTGTMRVEDGAVVSSEYGRIAEHGGSVGHVVVSGTGAVWDAGSNLSIGATGQQSSLAVEAGGRLEVANDINVISSRIDLAGGRIDADILRFHNVDTPLSGFGEVNGRLHGQALSVTAAGGVLRLGDADHADGVSLHSDNGVTVESGATLELIDADVASLYGSGLTLNNGVVIARSGLEAHGTTSGHGVIVGPANVANQPVNTPTGTVSLEHPLDVGSSLARVYSIGAARLGTQTTLDGGMLVAPNGLQLAVDDVIAGHGQVLGSVELANAVVAADATRPLVIAGVLSGHGVVLGPVQPSVDAMGAPAGAVDLSGGLEVGGRTAVVYSQGAARLGDRTTLAGGTIRASDGLRVDSGGTIAGFGTLEADVELGGGALEVEGGVLAVTAALSGHGLIYGPASLTAASTVPPAQDLVLDGTQAVAARVVRLRSMGPALLTGVLSVAGGALESDTGLAIAPGGLLSGHGTIGTDVSNEGRIQPVGTLTFDHTLRSAGAAIEGGTIAFTAGGGFQGAGVIDADINTASGATLVATGDLTAGTWASSAGVVLDGQTLAGPHAIVLRDADAARLGGDVRLGGGSLSAPNGLTVTGLVTGRGTMAVDPGATLANTGAMAFSGLTDVRGDVANQASGQITAAGGQPATFWDDVVNDGTITAGDGTTIVYYGTVSGTGSFPGPGTQDFRGDLHPGSSPAVIGFGGDVRFGAASGLVMELGGEAPGDGHDQLAIAGTARLAGTLRVSLLEGFVPDPFQAFALITAGLREGRFDAVEFEAPWPGLSIDLDYNADGVVLHPVALPGDLNYDAFVDFGDLATLAPHFGATAGRTWFDGDLNDDGAVNIADLDLMAATFGTSPTQGPMGITTAQLARYLPTVPEPGGLLVMVVLSALAGRRTGRGRV